MNQEKKPRTTTTTNTSDQSGIQNCSSSSSPSSRTDENVVRQNLSSICGIEESKIGGQEQQQQRHSTSSVSSSIQLESSDSSSGFVSASSNSCCSNSLTSIASQSINISSNIASYSISNGNSSSSNGSSPTAQNFPSPKTDSSSNFLQCNLASNRIKYANMPIEDDYSASKLEEENDPKCNTELDLSEVSHSTEMLEADGEKSRVISKSHTKNDEDQETSIILDENSPKICALAIECSDPNEGSIKNFSQSGVSANEPNIALTEVARTERSNSYSEAERASSVALASVMHLSDIASTSLSHDNLATEKSIENSIASSLRKSPTNIKENFKNRSEDQLNSIVHSRTNQNNDLNANESSKCGQDLHTDKESKQAGFQEGRAQTSSSRFFPSRLNTGSLWSLLSVGGGNNPNNQADQIESSLSPIDVSSNNTERNYDFTKSSKQQVSGYLDRISLTNSFNKSKNNTRQLNEQANNQMGSSASSNKQVVVANQQLNYERKKFRFPVKYIGNAMLHKNFTLPMLEWIAKDIKRQTVKSQSRQFTIPTRDIILEIQAYQLTAVNCKDGHCIFVHPMDKVSKYVQLQLEPNCFAYIIRDNRESTQFCHIFQAKSTNKIHEIFSAIREATTSTYRLNSSNSNMIPSTAAISTQTGQMKSFVQRSASTDVAGLKSSSNLSVYSKSPKENERDAQNQFGDKPHLTMERDIPVKRDLNFENSYQFEVMFVKRVKLQCRRVPPTFVDDALETLKSFEVLKSCDMKNAQIKGKSRGIINISVDERQEYDEACQSPTPGQQPRQIQETIEETRRSSLDDKKERANEEKSCEGSKSCQQSPMRHKDIENDIIDQLKLSTDIQDHLKKGQSSDRLDTTQFSNDFSPYNTITSSGLNERIAAIPVVSHGSVSLDHETRQRLARQVRETIQATAANIKKDVYARGSDKLKTSLSLKAIDSLSCTVASEVPSVEESSISETESNKIDEPFDESMLEHRRSSASLIQKYNQALASTNNFEALRRASARQVVKNRTMLLLIGKEELCAISIDKHQILFSKSFSQILHCLQGNTNRDHFGIICRESGKINPTAESHAGFIFKCQSEKVVREIMSALKQVIYSSQHNYHGYHSPYNPLNNGQLLEPKTSNPGQLLSDDPNGTSTNSRLSLAAKRGFSKPIEIDEAVRQASNQVCHEASTNTVTSTGGNSPSIPISRHQSTKQNLIKSMFCDNCPLYWYHRLCCDIESLPADAIKGIILRRINSSLTEKEQDTLYSKFSEYEIGSIDEHNEIFMSLLRHLCESKQLKHSQTQSHQSMLTKNINLSKQQQSQVMGNTKNIQTNLDSATISNLQPSEKSTYPHHQRSGSTGGSFISSVAENYEQLADAASFSNLKKAKNSISSSIENIFKRRSSIKDEEYSEDQIDSLSTTSDRHSRSGSFKVPTSKSKQSEIKSSNEAIASSIDSNLKRSQSSSDSCGDRSSQTNLASWRDSLTRTIHDDLSNPFAGLFRRRSSTLTGGKVNQSYDEPGNQSGTFRTSAESLVAGNTQTTPVIGTPSLTASNNEYNSSSVLSSAFWKKSIFDKIRQPVENTSNVKSPSEVPKITQVKSQVNSGSSVKKRDRTEIRAMWRKAILDQITLIKMDKQNQRLQALTPSNKTGQTTEQNEQNQPDNIKLNYHGVPYAREAPSMWHKILKKGVSEKVSFVEVARLVRLGIPRHLRGDAWIFLLNQYQLRHGTSFQPPENDFRGDANQPYRDLLSQLSVQQHEIFVDIGRTFPTHPYYSQYLSIGQLSLFNLLKAYSLLDQDVGYCQGLSFVAGILLLHVESEDEAFELMRHLLFNFGLRKQYLPSMDALHLQLYQITRLLRDHEFELFNHFDHYDISPSLYAAPWFLTLFASQFPLGFVTRLLDLVFLIGIEAVFRVSLNLLAHHRKSILDCHGLEPTMEYLKERLVKISDKDLVQIFDRSFSLDLRNELIEYEIEYTFYCAEDCRIKNVRDNVSKSSFKSETPTESDDKRSQIETGQNEVTLTKDGVPREDESKVKNPIESTSLVANATATVIIQHLLSDNHLKSIRSNYTY